MTATDDLKSAFGAYLDATEERLESMEAKLDSLTPVVQPPPVDQPPVETPPSDSQNPPENDPPSDDAPVIADPDLVYTIVQPSDPMPAADGTNAKVFTVPDKYGTIRWQWIHNAKPYKIDLQRLADPDADHVTFQEVHASGQTPTFHKNAKLITWSGEFYPDDTPATPPPSGSTTTSSPPATKPPAATTVPPPPVSKDAASPVDPSRLGFRVTPSDGSAVRTFDMASLAPQDLGDWQPGSFVQRNVKLSDLATGDTVFLRPDTTSGRMEIVYERGNPFFAGTPTHAGAYTAEILLDGEVIDTVAVPQHYWDARWRWQSSLRPIIRQPADLFAAKIYPSMGRIADAQKMPGIVPAYSEMTISSITGRMRTTGERPDIGVTTEYVGCWLATADPVAAYSVRQWAEASATFPMHRRDPATGAPIDWRSYPKSNTYSDQRYSNPPIAQGPSISNIAFEDAHDPQLAFVMFMVTDDLFYLEEVQFTANACIHTSPTKPDLFNQTQTRGWAWSLRNFIDAVTATPTENLTGSLLPASYFQNYLDINLADVMANCVNATSGKAHDFFSGPSAAQMPLWQEDYFATELGVAIYRGFTAWQPVFDWKIKSDLARTDESSGWPVGVPCVYELHPYIPTYEMGADNKGTGTIDFPLPGGESRASVSFLWGEGTWRGVFTDATHFDVYAPGSTVPNKTGNVIGDKPFNNSLGNMVFTLNGSDFAANDNFTITVTIPHTWAELAEANGVVGTPDGLLSKTLTKDYPMTVRSSLVMGELLGSADCKAALDRWDAQITTNYPMAWRYSFLRAA